MNRNGTQLENYSEPLPFLRLTAEGITPETAIILIRSLKETYRYVRVKVVQHRCNVDVMYSVGGLRE